jgi:hypothetical protein
MRYSMISTKIYNMGLRCAVSKQLLIDINHKLAAAALALMPAVWYDLKLLDRLA